MAKYKFEEIAYISTEKKKPTPADKNTYLGLEHLDSECLQVTRFGSDVAPVGEKLVMRQGDVLFGKRRAYQRKVAIAPFDGIFSAHGMVLRPNTNVIIKELFPFFISSKQFLDEAIKISVGSLSPTINGRDLKVLEFDIPPLEEQAKLADVLWAFEKTKSAYKTLLASTEDLVQAQFIEMFGDPIANPQKWPCLLLGKAGEFKNGLNYSAKDAGHTIRCFGVGDFQDRTYIESFDDIPFISLAALPSKEYLLENGDLLFVRSNGNRTLVGRCIAVFPKGINVTFSGFCIRFRKKTDSVSLLFLNTFLHNKSIKNKMLNNGRGVNITNLNQKMLSDLVIPIPPLALQTQFSIFTKSIKNSQITLQHSLSALEQARNALMEKIFR